MDKDTRTNIYVALALVLMLVGLTLALRGISRSRRDTLEEKNIFGGVDQASRELAAMSQVCWSKNIFREEIDSNDCFKASLNLRDGDYVEKDDVLEYLDDDVDLTMPQKISDGSSFEIRFLSGSNPTVIMD